MRCRCSDTHCVFVVGLTVTHHVNVVFQARIAKRDRKLVDYDSARHNYATTHKTKKKDGGIKITKVKQIRTIDVGLHIQMGINRIFAHSFPAFHLVGTGHSRLGSGYLVSAQPCPEQSF